MKKKAGEKNYPLAFIGNMDETTVYFDLVPDRVVDTIGVKSVLVNSTGGEKRHITVALTVTANGEIPTPFIIFKGKRQPKLEVITDYTLTEHFKYCFSFHRFKKES